MPHTYIKRILNARVYDVAKETPLDTMPILSARIDNHILLKREDLQPVFSFKLRGAYNKMYQLSETAKARGVVAASAGNHAQGLALAANKMGVKATIVMPRTTPGIKVDAVKARGGKVVLHGDTYDEASAFAQALVAEKGMTYVHPYDDPDVIAGQGTVAVEILRQHPDPIHAVFVPVGGGGLCAGVAAYIKQVRPDIRVIAVEPVDAACYAAALKAKKIVTLPQVGLFADGTAVATIGSETFRVMRKTVDEVITCTTDEICAAIKDIFDDTRSIAEPSGALALAGLKKYAQQHQLHGENLVAIDSGANTNFDRLRYISERTEIGEKREAVLAVTIPEKPGSFKAFCSLLGKRNITEFNYRYANSSEAHLFVGLQVAGDDIDRTELVNELLSKNYSVQDLTDNELAKLHVRHLVGGLALGVANERVFHFEFPERPGALMQFLQALAGRWNITLFHYRNHGSSDGRVLIALDVPPADEQALQQFLIALNYPWKEETANPAYQLFLGGSPA